VKVETPTPCVHVYREAFDGSKLIRVLEELSCEEWPRLSWERSGENRPGDDTNFVSEYRSSLGMSLVPLMGNEVVEELKEAREELVSVFSGIDECVWDYREINSLELARSEPFTILKYSDNAEYRTHWDSSPSNGRVLSLVAYMNDDYEGGELDFPLYGVSVKPENGMVLLFPSGFQHKHTARPVTSGTKYSFVTWFQ